MCRGSSIEARSLTGSRHALDVRTRALSAPMHAAPRVSARLGAREPSVLPDAHLPRLSQLAVCSRGILCAAMAASRQAASYLTTGSRPCIHYRLRRRFMNATPTPLRASRSWALVPQVHWRCSSSSRSTQRHRVVPSASCCLHRTDCAGVVCRFGQHSRGANT